MRKNVFFIAFLSLIWINAAWADDLKLWYKQPAQVWVEALPLSIASTSRSTETDFRKPEYGGAAINR